MSILKRCIKTLTLSISCIFLCSNSFAHHGSVVNPNLYLAENLVELEGEITDVFWRSPHPRYRLRVPNGDLWELELSGSPLTYRRVGLSEEDIARVGETIKVAGYISRMDAKSLGVLHILLPNGQEFVNGNRDLRWSSVRRTAETLDLDPIKVETAIRNADGLFRVWGPVRSPELEEADYVHMLTATGQQLSAAYDPIADNYELECRQGMPDTMFDRGAAMDFVDEGDRILIHLEEYDIERVIYMSDQTGQMQTTHSDLGYSTGRWQGEDLIVETAGIDWPYYDEVGIPQSTQVSHLERFSVSADGNTLDYELTINDPVIFSGPLVLTTTRQWAPGREVEHYGCIANWDKTGILE
jgi:hypothetical protein